MEALVSIIVPVYNLEGYVDNCLNSLVNQTYRNIEILCIDDGSTDKSADVIKSFAEKDDRVVYVYKDNGGVSSARNLGLDMFKGDYVMFVDGDDYLHPQAVEIFLECMEKTGCDIASSDIEITSFLEKQFILNSNCDFGIISLSDFLSSMPSVNIRSACGKLYTRSVADSQRFSVTVVNGEDNIYFFKILSEFNQIAQIHRELYYYYSRCNSASKSIYNISSVTILDGLSDLGVFLESKKSELLLGYVLNLLYKTIFLNKTIFTNTAYENDVIEKCSVLGKKWFYPLLRNKHIKIKKKILIVVFYKVHFLYELARLIQDPTMLDFYKNRRKHNGKSQKD